MKLVLVRWKTLWTRKIEGKRSGPHVYLTATKTWYRLKRFLGTGWRIICRLFLNGPYESILHTPHPHQFRDLKGWQRQRPCRCLWLPDYLGNNIIQQERNHTHIHHAVIISSKFAISVQDNNLAKEIAGIS